MKTITKLLALIAVTLVFQTSVSAHTKMTAVSPANDEVLTVAPQNFSVQYSKPVRLVKLSLTDANDKKIKLPHQLEKLTNTDHKIALPQLSDGQYKLSWILMGKDGHKMKGKLNFAIAGDAS